MKEKRNEMKRKTGEKGKEKQTECESKNERK